MAKTANNLENCIRRNLKMHRKSMGLTQAQMADFVGLKRSSYTKKEIGDTAILIRDVEILSDSLDISVVELMKGYPGLTSTTQIDGLSAAAKQRFGIIRNIIEQANVAAESGEKVDYDFLIKTIDHARVKLAK